jgi:hypothetical protein
MRIEILKHAIKISRCASSSRYCRSSFSHSLLFTSTSYEAPGPDCPLTVRRFSL